MTPTERQHWLFTKGWETLADMYQWPEAKARRAVGKLRQAAQGPELAMRAVLGIERHKPVDPVPWALAGIRANLAKAAEKHRPGFRPVTDLPPQVPLDERVRPERFDELKAILGESR